jgi:hypothetical protein
VISGGTLSALTHVQMLINRFVFTASLLLGVGHASAQVLTSQYNNARTGATLTETTLTPENVNTVQ